MIIGQSQHQHYHDHHARTMMLMMHRMDTIKMEKTLSRKQTPPRLVEMRNRQDRENDLLGQSTARQPQQQQHQQDGKGPPAIDHPVVHVARNVLSTLHYANQYLPSRVEAYPDIPLHPDVTLPWTWIHPCQGDIALLAWTCVLQSRQAVVHQSIVQSGVASVLMTGMMKHVTYYTCGLYQRSFALLVWISIYRYRLVFCMERILE
jgi:hypothetical protein